MSDELRALLREDPELAEVVADELRAMGYTVVTPEPVEAVPFVTIGAGERAPWADKPLDCPECGEGPLPLQESTSSGMGGTGLTLRYISHCGGTWLRGEADL